MGSTSRRLGLCFRDCKYFAPILLVEKDNKRPSAISNPASLLLCAGGQCGGVHWIAAFAPGLEAALERADALDAIFSKEQRHTGAGGFVWSSAEEDDLAVARQAVVLLLKRFGVHAERAGNRFWISFEVHGVAQVHDG